MRFRLDGAGYEEVKTPQLVDRKLWEDSGHWEKFREHMFTTGDAADEDAGSDDRILALKPMNCPCHVQIFNQGIKSYRDLPLKMSEFGSCHRNEPSGALHGIMRVRAFTQDDAHIFATPDQVTEQTKEFCTLLTQIYADFGFTDVAVKFSDRPEKRAGTDETWDKAEGALREAIEDAGLPYTMNPGEGAFYGPKLDFSLTDTVGPGAVVSFNNRNFIVAVSTTRFDVDGVTYMGISPQSPIYKAMVGAKAGESFEHNGRSFVIEDVL